MKWTNEQLEAINKEGTNIIVSAGAGSGKTAVLTERVIRKINDGVNINRLLLLTFTKAASHEMKERIKKRLIKENNTHQLELLDSAFITTFDSFSSSIVKKYSHILNINSNINVLDDDILNYESNKILDEIFNEIYETKSSELKLIDSFTTKDDKTLKADILKLSNSLNLRIDKKEYLENYIVNTYNDEVIDSYIKDYHNYINSIINEIKELEMSLSHEASENLYEVMSKYLTNIYSDNYDVIRTSLNNKFPTTPSSESEEAKIIKGEIKTKIDTLKVLLDFKDLKEDYLSTKEYVSTIINIILELDKRLEEFKMSHNAYTYSDVARMAIDVVKVPEVNKEIKEMFDEIMIDEYQDTSDIQEEFISLISNNNVYMVGDIKQSIYKFRNANVNIFKDKYDNYSKGNNGYKIDLSRNFRSRTEVIDNINNIFTTFMTDTYGGANYKDGHTIIFGNNTYNEYKDDVDYNVKVINYEDKKYESKDEKEAFIIASDIKRVMDSKLKVYDRNLNELRSVRYSDFAILMDRSTSFDTYKKVFEYLNIPLEPQTKINVKQDSILYLFKNIFSLLLMDKNSYEYKHAYTSLLRGPIFNKSDNEIYNLINSKKDLDILNEISLNTLSETVEDIIKVFKMHENSIKVGNVEEFSIKLDFIIEKCYNLESLGYTHKEFLNYLNYLILNDEDLSLMSITKSESSVSIMTIHYSKGLEYEMCYYPGLYKKFNMKDNSDRFKYHPYYGIIVPYYNIGTKDLFINHLIKDDYKMAEISEKIRLFYVALTRAKSKMTLVYPNEFKKITEPKDIRSNLDIVSLVDDYLSSYKELSNVEIDKNYLLEKKDTSIYKSKEKDSININEYIHESLDLEESSYSKKINDLIDIDTYNALELGNNIHYILEMIDFNNPNYDLIDIKYKDYIKSFIDKIDIPIKTYKEYEFVYEDGNSLKTGVVDLILEYDDHIKVIDYKLKNIDDEAYIKQLNGYKDYLSTITHKEIKIYLYSILNKELKEV